MKMLMRIIEIELMDEQAIPLLQQLEKIKWLRIVKSETKAVKTKPKFKLGGVIPKNAALDMHDQLKEIRASWERDI